MSGQKRSHSIDVAVRDWPHLANLLCFRPTRPEALDRLQILIDRAGDQFLLRPVLEHPDDPGNPLIDGASPESAFDHALANGLEPLGVEFFRKGTSVHDLEGPDGQAKIVQLGGRRPVGAAVVVLGVVPERQQQLVDRQIRGGVRGR